MSIPGNMKTGLTVGVAYENMFPETFFIVYLILGAFLRRSGFKDSMVYSDHNSIIFTQDIFDSGVLFNLFSEYGVGKSLEPLIHELFSTISLDPIKNKDNIFFREIVRLTNIVSNVIRSHDPKIETIWIMKYAMNMDKIIDPIAIERHTRLAGLFGHSYSSDSDSSDSDSDDSSDSDPFYTDYCESDESIDIISSISYDESNIINVIIDGDNNNNNNNNNLIDNKICLCDFCEEFRKYHNQEKVKNISEVLNDVLMKIASDINKEKILNDPNLNFI